MKKLMIKHKSKILILTILMIIVIFTFTLMIFCFEKSLEDIQLKSQTSPQNTENIAQLIEVGTLSQKSAIPTTVISASITFNNITTSCFLLKDGRKLCKVGTIKVSSGDVKDIDVVVRGRGS